MVEDEPCAVLQVILPVAVITGVSDAGMCGIFANKAGWRNDGLEISYTLLLRGLADFGGKKEGGAIFGGKEDRKEDRKEERKKEKLTGIRLVCICWRCVSWSMALVSGWRIDSEVWYWNWDFAKSTSPPTYTRCRGTILGIPATRPTIESEENRKVVSFIAWTLFELMRFIGCRSVDSV